MYRKMSRFLIFNFAFCCIFGTNAYSMSFVKTKGIITRLDEEHRFPAKGKILECAKKCNPRFCHCIRISADSSAKCEAFNFKTDVNRLNGTGYVYYTWDRYNDTLNGPNVALTKPSMQSSNFENSGIQYTADRAVDGNRNIEAFEAPYISSTKENPADRYPWWQVDLKADYLITGVTIFNRKDFADRLHDMEIRVGNTLMTNAFSNQVFDKNLLCAEQIGKGIAGGSSKTFICSPCPIYGRYVSIQIVRNCSQCSQPNVNILHLAEVDVHGFLASSVA